MSCYTRRAQFPVVRADFRIGINVQESHSQNRARPAKSAKPLAGTHGASFELHGVVIFFFEQEGRYTRCEVQPRSDGASEIIVTPPDGSQTVEVLCGSDVTRRISELRESMLQAGWWGPLGREF